MGRKYIDCREIPSDIKCTVAISADSEDELLEAAVQHAVTVHQHQDSPQLREQIRAAFKEGPAVVCSEMAASADTAWRLLPLWQARDQRFVQCHLLGDHSLDRRQVVEHGFRAVGPKRSGVVAAIQNATHGRL